MISLPQAMQKLIREFSRLPSIGEKSATRLAYHLVNHDKQLALSLSDALRKAAESVKLCQRCFYLTEEDLCTICKNPSRDQSLICLVEKPADLMAIERVGEFRGLYHVLHGLWAPLRGQGPESMKLQELLERLKDGVIREVIIATGSTVEGDATALYVAKMLSDFGVQSTRLAQGMPKGGELEYADDVTLSRAFAGRNLINP
ncbi:MAG: recombination protein RecR [Deltaproteobacteria bacterium]|nr:recombination protein RecR [Deltaproteobacteria bacterium]